MDNKSRQWNWFSFLLSFAWLLYKKLYFWFIVLIFIFLSLLTYKNYLFVSYDIFPINMISNANQYVTIYNLIDLIILFLIMLITGIFGNVFYNNKYKNKSYSTKLIHKVLTVVLTLTIPILIIYYNPTMLGFWTMRLKIQPQIMKRLNNVTNTRETESSGIKIIGSNSKDEIIKKLLEIDTLETKSTSNKKQIVTPITNEDELIKELLKKDILGNSK